LTIGYFLRNFFASFPLRTSNNCPMRSGVLNADGRLLEFGRCAAVDEEGVIGLA
jgi:hypothetical protein